ncbi:unnamed protein product [Vitrella brassicaformis CCMP3155]|uniref:Uncharacterized protein n=2 Tax=Vitrella brassicaformis TaxID=1169539 RepID=A0A0G4FFU4_VITBC|nr:unnamed protein product [Vitrella brassicaformis CCMP3155]|eukprot:CEM11923.1 unnamed protein product [Vitrella brassicaformis CCMP3155]
MFQKKKRRSAKTAEAAKREEGGEAVGSPPAERPSSADKALDKAPPAAPPKEGHDIAHVSIAAAAEKTGVSRRSQQCLACTQREKENGELKKKLGALRASLADMSGTLERSKDYIGRLEKQAATLKRQRDVLQAENELLSDETADFLPLPEARKVCWKTLQKGRALQLFVTLPWRTSAGRRLLRQALEKLRANRDSKRTVVDNLLAATTDRERPEPGRLAELRQEQLHIVGENARLLEEVQSLKAMFGSRRAERSLQLPGHPLPSAGVVDHPLHVEYDSRIVDSVLARFVTVFAFQQRRLLWTTFARLRFHASHLVVDAEEASAQRELSQLCREAGEAYRIQTLFLVLKCFLSRRVCRSFMKLYAVHSDFWVETFPFCHACQAAHPPGAHSKYRRQQYMVSRRTERAVDGDDSAPPLMSSSDALAAAAAEATCRCESPPSRMPREKSRLTSWSLPLSSCLPLLTRTITRLRHLSSPRQ